MEKEAFVKRALLDAQEGKQKQVNANLAKGLSDVNVDKLKKEILSQIQENPLYDALIEEYETKGYTMDFLTFYEIYKNRLLCQDCSGLSFCKQSQKGIRMTYNGSLVYQPCPYLNEKEVIKQGFEGLVYSTYEFDQALPTFESVDLTKTVKMETINYVLIGGRNLKQGFYLYGPPGVGKTYLMLATMQYYLKEGYKCAFVRMNDLYIKISKLLTSKSENDKQLLNNTFLKLKNVDVLFVDDIGIEQIDMEFRDSFLMPLLNNRMEKGLLTFFTSNVPINELHQRYQINQYGVPNDLTKGQYIEERIMALAKLFHISDQASLRHESEKI